MHGAGRANISGRRYMFKVKTMEYCAKLFEKTQEKHAIFLNPFKFQEEFYANAPDKHSSIRFGIS